LKAHALRFALGVLTSAVLLVGCGEDSTTASLRALDPGGEISVVCLARASDGRFTEGVETANCPDYPNDSTNPQQRRLHALVTQPATGEVALVDLAVSPDAAVIDFEPTQPGFSFMPVGAEPGAIVSTPGGKASFVGVKEAGREGVFALPSSCLAPRPATAPLRDIRTWPACRLPVAPGPMALIDDPAIDDDGDASTAPRVRERCDADYVDPADLIGKSPAAVREQCPADLATEQVPLGRRKLLVSLPSLSELWVLDAQELLDRAPGSFDACSVERRLTLDGNVQEVTERIPADLVPSSASCNPVGFNHGPRPALYSPSPSDFALDDEGRLFVADSAAPLVHVLDVNDPCAITALPPLQPMSYIDPTAVITTRRVAVSELTPGGKRFVYAVDGSETRTAGTLIAFDISPGSNDRAPIVRERSPYNPGEPPDRITLGGDVADIQFATQDFPQPTNGVAIEGVACDPHPGLPTDDPATFYRPRSDLSSGARPTLLRGTFAFAALHSGDVAVVDVEDLDQSCRRPVTVSSSTTEENIYGCKNDDPTVIDGYVQNFIPTVSNELSCNVVTPHRARSRGFFTNSSASLVSFPTLTLDTGRAVATDQSDEGRDQPKLLGARHSNDPLGSERLYVGPLFYDTSQTSAPIELDPARADRSSVLLNYEEPRTFSPGEQFTATYEGVVRGGGEARLSVEPTTGAILVDEGLNASFCNSGVQDMDVSVGVAATLGVPAADSAAFARLSSDYVQVTAAFRGEKDAYWFPPSAGATCGTELYGSSAITGVSGLGLCYQYFGPPENPTTGRDLRILEASEDGLLVEPRDFDPSKNSSSRRQLLGEFVTCCFPDPALFQVRAGHQWVVRGSGNGFLHHITTDPESHRCVTDCNPLNARLNGRAFEIACSGDCPVDDRNRPAVGVAPPGEDFACVVDDGARGGILPGEQGSECVFQSLTTRFAIYRGLQPTLRDTRFRWQFAGGFTPFVTPLTTTTSNVSTPRSMLLVPEISQFLITDGSARGITLLSPRNPVGTASIF